MEIYDIQLNKYNLINKVLSECGRTRFLFIAHKVGFACLSLS